MTQALAFLALECELKERDAALEGLGLLLAQRKALESKHSLVLKRSFNQKNGKGGYIKFWRVVGPVGHRFLNSDISQEWLKEQGYIH